jgi:3-deoxy-D-manno-octulosonic-acid transferase
MKEEKPSVSIYISTATVAGRKAAEIQAEGIASGIFYGPIDYVSCIRRALCAIRPALVVILETEIWPNLYAETKRFGASLALVNGRISDRTWPRYRFWRKAFCPILQFPDLILTQSAKDRERFASLGAPEYRLEVAPNLKYDAAVSATPLLLDAFGAEQVWIAASTVGPNERGSSVKHSVDEDEHVLSVFEGLSKSFPKLLMILAPRQPARFDEVAKKIERRNLNFVRRSQLKQNTASRLELPGVLLLDTMGELPGIYQVGTVTFVGGSIAPRGGHNILEPAAAGSPIVVGPHMENFAAITQDFLDAGALVQITKPEELLPAVNALLTDRAKAREIASRAEQLVKRQRGSSNRIAEHLWFLYYGASLRRNRSRLVRLFLLPLARLWREGGALKRKHFEHFTLMSPPLVAPVISVGGITTGGQGKTPFTVYLVNQLENRGRVPAILTRGYRRRSPAETLIFAAGVKVPPAVTGDEAQIFLRSTNAPIGIGTKRYETAQMLLRQYPDTNVLVLDDGFQHARLERDFDVVLIDGLDPFGGGEIVPLGRLREPLSALKRADVFVVTRAEEEYRFEAIRRRLNAINARAPVFRTRLIARCWREAGSCQKLDSLASERVGAFCALGNPESFWRTLEQLGLQVVFRWPFPDHHAYNPTELQRVAHHARMSGATTLVTTEKDYMNCPSHVELALMPVKLAWLEIELELENQDALFEILDNSLRQPRTKQLVYLNAGTSSEHLLS